MKLLAVTEDVLQKGMEKAKQRVSEKVSTCETNTQVFNFCNLLLDTVMCERGVATELGTQYRRTKESLYVRFSKSDCMQIHSFSVTIQEDFGTQTFFNRFLEHAYTWFKEYVSCVRAIAIADEINKLMEVLLADADIPFTVSWSNGVHIQFIDDCGVVFGNKAQELTEIFEYLQAVQQNAVMLESFIDTFKMCTRPVELLCINNEVTHKLGIYTRNSLFKKLKQVHNRRFESAHTGVSILRADEYITVIRAEAATEEQIQLLPDDMYYIRENTRPTLTERTREQKFMVYSFVVKPIGNYCIPVDVSLQKVVDKYQPML